MMKRLSFILAAVLMVCCLLSGCHGSRGLEAFVMPEEFDTSRDYEITFWAKNDTNKAQTNVYKKAIED
ncbi:MAG: ABC transporter substrate-binding protein, partial [Firmicutes bacterium]|nr:ABC transporter substrate-binding protein [Bacillota bacterium]